MQWVSRFTGEHSVDAQDFDPRPNIIHIQVAYRSRISSDTLLDHTV